MAHRSLQLLLPRLHRQHGVLTVAQATSDGVDRRELRRLRVARLLVPEQLHVLRCPLVPRTWEGAAMAALLAAGPQAALARWAAARLHGLVHGGRLETELSLIQPRGRNLRDSVPRARRSTRLGPGDVVTLDGFRVTTVAWTLVELVPLARPRTMERIAGRAVAERLVRADDLRDLATRLHGTTGARSARWLLSATGDVEPRSRSRGESGFVRLVVGAGLPRPELNHRVTDDGGVRRELDAAWPRWGVAVELDLHPSHGTTIGRRLDGRRQNDLIGAWDLLRFDEHDLATDAAGVVRQVRTALRRAGWSEGT